MWWFNFVIILSVVLIMSTNVMLYNCRYSSANSEFRIFGRGGPDWKVKTRDTDWK